MYTHTMYTHTMYTIHINTPCILEFYIEIPLWYFFGFERVLRRTALAVKLHIPPFQLAVSMCAILGIFIWLVVLTILKNIY
jgi:hypothetical protein